MFDAPPTADTRSYADILAQIRTLAARYAPEWRFGPEHPDAGTALGCLFAGMLSGSIERFNQMPINHRAHFYNRLGAASLPASPASGAVCFLLSGEGAEGTFIPKDFKLFSPVTDDTGKRYLFETQRELFVTPARLTDIIFTDYANDRIRRRGDSEGAFPAEGNEQSHRLIFTHAQTDAADENTRLFLYAESRMTEAWLTRLSDPALVSWSLARGEETYPLTCLRAGDRLLLRGFKGETAPDTQVTAAVCDAGAFDGLTLDGLSVVSEADGIIPAVLCNGEELTDERLYPFGREFSVYDEVCFLCDAALCQAGAEVTLSFETGYDLWTTDAPSMPLPTKFVIAKKNLPQTIPDTRVALVAWEYFNGLGFAPLKPQNPAAAERLFSALDEYGRPAYADNYRITFTCPEDMAEWLTGARRGFCIRARVREVSGAYKRPARVFTPWIRTPRFSFRHRRPSPVLRGILENNLESRPLLPYGGQPFARLTAQGRSLYFCFNAPLEGGPIGMLIDCDGKPDGRTEWSLYTARGWQALPARDETDGFAQTGLVTFPVVDGMARRVLFGTEGYWLRAETGSDSAFMLNTVHLNAVPVLQCETVDTEFFAAEEGSRRLQLQHDNILDETVWVNEERRPGQPKDGDNWVMWARADGSAPDKTRRYRIDRAHGRITFPGGTGPLHKTAQYAVKVRYRHGGGSGANLPANTPFMPSLALGYVNASIAPLALTGGYESEAPGETVRRLGDMLRHGGLPVTVGDYADLALEPGIAAVSCTADGHGGVTVALLVEEWRSVHAFEHAQRRVTEKLQPLMPAGVMLTVRPPLFVRVTVEAAITPTGAETAAHEILARLCDPLQHAQAYGFGILPDAEMVYNALSAIPGVMEVSRLFMRYETDDGEIIEPPAFALPVGGRHSLRNGMRVC